MDEKWYARFEKIGAFQDFEYLEGEKKHREEQKKQFFNEAVRNPDLGYPKLEKFDFAGIEEDLLILKKEILQQESNEAVKQAYHWKINEKIAQLRMLKASKEGNDRKVSRYSNFIYGMPEREIFEYDLTTVKQTIEAKRNDVDLRVQFAIRRLEQAINFGEDKIRIHNEILPTKRRVAEYPFVNEKKFDANEIQKEFQAALEELETRGWEVVIKDNITAISVSQEKKQVKIPEKKKLTEIGLKQLIAHEIETHVLRRENGEKSKLKLLGLGLDRYLTGEEGISTFEEQKIGGADDFAGFDGHLAISLAVGMDGEKRTSERFLIF